MPPHSKVFALLVLSCALLLVACDGNEGAASHRTGDEPKGGAADTAPAPQAGWKTSSWALPRGGQTLSGRVDDRLPRDPKIEWSVELDGAVIADAAIADETVYIGSIMGTFYALDFANGKERWKFVTEDTIEAPPTVALGKVFVGSNDRFFYCLDQKSGKMIWKFEGADKFISGALIVRSADDSEDWVVVNGYDGICRCLRAKDGSVVWTYETDDQINSTPTIVNHDTVVFGGCDMVVHAVRLADGKNVNKVEVDAEIVGTLATVGSMTYSANYANQLVAVDAFGKKPAWIYQDKDFPFFASPAVNDEMVFIGSRDKHLHAVKRKTGVRAWKVKTGSRVDGSAIVFDDAVVFGSGDGRLYALNPKDGREIWRLDLGEGLSTDPAFAKGRIVIGGTDATLFCIVGKQINE